ncbi:MAG: hypothetical protein ACXADU_06300 [Promethearchaeota archaeon]|jgi:hypothetical protein
MVKTVNWSNYFSTFEEKTENFVKSFGTRKVYAIGLMPVRGSSGFRKLDYEYAEKKINVNEIITRLKKAHFNTLGIVIKDTDGACIWNTRLGWNPMNRDILGEFCDAGKDNNIKIIVSFTSMNDAYQGFVHPERVSVHGKNGKKLGRKYFKGEISTHLEGEMRVDLPKGVLLEDYQQKIPFLTDQIDEEKGKARSARGKGLIPLTSFMCPNSAHIDYLLDLTKEVIRNYSIQGFFVDYIRYDNAFSDLCACERCLEKFRKKYGKKSKLLKSKEWYDFKSNTITAYALKLHNSIKSIDQNCMSGWFCLPGPRKFLSKKRLGQDWTALSSILDIASPMEYPYLMGTRDDGYYWGKIGDFFYWYFIRNMKKRAKEYRSPVLAITNSVECRTDEMVKQLKNFDFGSGIAVFKYFGTSEEQWDALKRYAEKEIGVENLIFRK